MIPQCPRCGQPFSQNMNMQLIFEHARNCNAKKGSSATKQQQFVYEKTSIDENMTKFKWDKMPKNLSNDLPVDMAPSDVKKYTFQEKEKWLRKNLQSLRISWTEGADWMKLNKKNLLIESLNQIKKVNMHKQVKIDFVGEKVNDAGGLLREWIHMVIKQVFDINNGIFNLCNTQDIMYRLKWDEDIDQIFSKELLVLLGIIIAKAIFQRVPINSYLDRTILRQLTGEIAKLSDVYGYDEELYKSFKHMQTIVDVQSLQTYFMAYHNTGGTIKQIQLLPDGKDIQATSQNKQLYIELYIQTIICQKVERSIAAIKQGIQQVFPRKWLSVFQPYELQMIMYGVPFIDIQQWHDNTEYKEPYNRGHPVIKWFWSVMETFHQDQLANILHFCTGSSRTPIQGFSKLQTNRGNSSKFIIVSSEFDKKNPYPKGYTCFNRLQLPLYPDYNTLREYLVAVSKREMDGIFGLD